MKILRTIVQDPRKFGTFKDPFITITVDEPVYEIADAVQVPSVPYRLIPCGPFYAVEYQTGPNHWQDISLGNSGDIGELNKYGLIKDQLFPVTVMTPPIEPVPDEEELDLAMMVPRVRRLLRKELGRTWKLIVDEEAALTGLLKWRVERSDPLCYGGAAPYSDRCANSPIQTVMQKGTHLPLCTKHLRAHEAELRTARLSTNH